MAFTTPTKTAFRSPAKSPRVNLGENGVDFWSQQVRQMIQPYGEAKLFKADLFFSTLQADRNEWLRRPLVAISEMISTVIENKMHFTGQIENLKRTRKIETN